MNSLVKRMCIAFLMLALTGCAYVEFRRVYEVRPELSVSQRVAVMDEVERYFLSRRFILKQKYHDYYPVDKHVTIMTIPRKTEEKRRDPILSISVDAKGHLQLTHSEWFLNEKPDDFLATSQTDLISKIGSALGIHIEVELGQKGYY